MFSNNLLEIIVETSYYQIIYLIEQHKFGSFIGKFFVQKVPRFTYAI